MRAFTIGPNDAGQRLDRFLGKALPGAPQGEVFRSLRKKKIRVNGKRVTQGGLRLAAGDRLELYISDAFFAAPEAAPAWMGLQPQLKVVYEDAHILVMDKPAGLLAQGDGVSLEGYMRAYLWRKGDYDPARELTFVPSLCHRIDRNTAGLVIGAKDAESLRILTQKIRDREIRKFYLCLTQGTPAPEQGEITGWLIRDEAERRMRFVPPDTPGALACRTRYRVLRPGPLALVEAELITGRTHQLRAGFAQLGHPLAGDVKYGAARDGSRRFQRLLAYRLVFDFPTDAGPLHYLRGKALTLPPEELEP